MNRSPKGSIPGIAFQRALIYTANCNIIETIGRRLLMTLHSSVRSSRSPSKCRPAINSALRGIATLMVAAGAAIAQTGGGATLVGTVKDATGATVSGAKVTVVNTATGPPMISRNNSERSWFTSCPSAKASVGSIEAA
jgi:hypothetical protein